MNSEVTALCRKLRLTHIPQAAGSTSSGDNEGYLLSILRAECEGREQSRFRRLVKNAGFGYLKTLEDYCFENITFPPGCTANDLLSLQFIAKNENVLMLGSVGTGKTHLAIALGLEACKAGKEVRFFRVADLMNTLQHRYHEGSLATFLRRLRKADLVILDEVGYVPFHQTGSELLFNIVADCYEKRSVIVTSNLEFGRWNSIFGDSHMTQALVDRLVHHAYILAFTGDSYRLKHALRTTSA